MRGRKEGRKEGRKGGKGQELYLAAPLRYQFWGAFVGANPPEGVPAHPSDEVCMNTGTLLSFGYLGSSFALQGHPIGNRAMG